MTKISPYRRPPITEAIIDLRVIPRSELSLQDFENFLPEQEASDWKKSEIVQAEGIFKFNEDSIPESTATRKQLGWRFNSDDGKSIVQLQRDRLSFSRLAPYPGWEAFRSEGRRLWNLFRLKTSPQSLCRLAVRYINRVDIPSTRVDLKAYFQTFPEISPDLPQEICGYLMQLVLPQSDFGGQALINQTIVPPPREGVTSIVLDIDLMSGGDVPTTEDEIWAFFERLHVRKNDIFEASITDKTRELFDS